MYETFEHTADLGIRIRATSLDELFAEAGCALMAALIGNPDAIQGVRSVELRVDGDAVDCLLLDWLNEILFRFDCRGELLTDFAVTVTDGGLTATARVDDFDERRHQTDCEIKAITYHGLKVEHVHDEWMAEVIVDL